LIGTIEDAVLGYIDSAISIGSGALILGLLLVVWGFYLRRGGKLRNLQGAAVLAGAAIAIGIAAMSAGAFFIVRAAWI
jgi:hypothetical protein